MDDDESEGQESTSWNGHKTTSTKSRPKPGPYTMAVYCVQTRWSIDTQVSGRHKIQCRRANRFRMQSRPILHCIVNIHFPVCSLQCWRKHSTTIVYWAPRLHTSVRIAVAHLEYAFRALFAHGIIQLYTLYTYPNRSARNEYVGVQVCSLPYKSKHRFRVIAEYMCDKSKPKYWVHMFVVDGDKIRLGYGNVTANKSRKMGHKERKQPDIHCVCMRIVNGTWP